MSIQLAKRLAMVKPSATLTLNAKAAQLKAEGKDVINLAVGEPDFDTPAFIKNAAIQAINDGFTKYTAVSGIIELKQAVCAKLQRDNQLHYLPEQIIISTGLKQALFNLMMATLNPVDEVIILAPYWVSYPEMVLLAEAKPVIVTARLENNLKISAADLAQAITPKTKMIVLNSPSNPSGVVYSRQDLAELADVLRQHPQILIASDDMYEKMYWGDEPFVNILNVAPDLYPRAIVMNGVSKAYAMTGWRIGYAAAPVQLIKAMDILQSQSTASANSIAQKAALAALNGPQECVTFMADEFKQRYQYLFQAFSSMEGVVVPHTEGAFYLYPYVQNIIDRFGLVDDVAFSAYLLDKLNLAVLPGSTCGTPGFIRISFATSMELLQEAMRRFNTLFQ